LENKERLIMAFKKITLEEWKAQGLPTEISTFNFGNSQFVNQLKEHQEKIKKEKEQKKCNK
tara:strand:- start:719 stop:901 length:183 start_codon:yes stop_codon:yes gene_type:complete